MNTNGVQWKLSIQLGNAKPYDVPLSKDRMTIGRGEHVDIDIESALISRQSPQGVLSFENGSWYYQDAGSVNGTFINGILYWRDHGNLAKIMLNDGDVLDIDAEHHGQHPNGLRIQLLKGTCCSYKAYLLKNERTLIGRSHECDVCIPSIRVSRKNAYIQRKGDQFVLDVVPNSAPVYVNRQLVQSAVTLVSRDLIDFSGTTAMFGGDSLYVNQASVTQGGVVLQVRDIVRTEKGKLNHVSFDIHKGELVAIIGGSGAGKTTLLKAISGSEHPVSGTVLYNGLDLFAQHDLLKSQIGFVPQKDIMHQDMSLHTMLQYAAKLRLQDDVSAEEQNERVEQVMEELNISGARNTSLKKVSGGQKKRASIAIEMLSDPDLFFLDEPTSGLDPGTERHLMQTLREISRKGKTVILVTHTTLTLPLCDKVIIMGTGGNMCYYGAPEDATAFFGTKDLVDIFDQIDTEEKANLYRERFISYCSFANQRDSVTNKGKQKRIHISVLRQTAILTSRYFQLILNQLVWMAMMLLSVPFLTVVVRFVSTDQLFNTYSNTYKTLFTLICVPVFVGLLTSNSEIVKERDILYREYSANMRISAYLFSKIIVMFLINALQSLILTTCFCSFVSMPTASLIFSPTVEMFITLFLTMFSMSCLGLFISAAIPSRNAVTIALSGLLVPQVVFSGAVFELEGVTRKIASIIHAFWGTNALAISCGMENLEMKETIIEKGLQAGMKFIADTPSKDYLFSNMDNLLYAWQNLLMLALVCSLASYLALRITVNNQHYRD